MKITIELTEEQAAAIESEIQKYAETLANDRIAQAVESKRAERHKLFELLTDAEKEIAIAGKRAVIEPVKDMEA
jgi:hypothetical protein